MICCGSCGGPPLIDLHTFRGSWLGIGFFSTDDENQCCQLPASLPKILPPAEQANLSEIIYSFPGLNLDPTNNNFVYPYLTSAPLRNVQLILWHDLINNTITSHSKKENIPQTVPQLIESLKSLQNLFCVVTCQRDGAPYFFEDLLKALPCYVIDVTKHIISATEQLNDTIISQYERFYQSADLELRSLSVTLHYQTNIKRIFKTRGTKRRNTSDRRETKKALKVKPKTLYETNLVR